MAFGKCIPNVHAMYVCISKSICIRFAYSIRMCICIGLSVARTLHPSFNPFVRLDIRFVRRVGETNREREREIERKRNTQTHFFCSCLIVIRFCDVFRLFYLAGLVSFEFGFSFTLILFFYFNFVCISVFMCVFSHFFSSLG